MADHRDPDYSVVRLDKKKFLYEATPFLVLVAFMAVVIVVLSNEAREYRAHVNQMRAPVETVLVERYVQDIEVRIDKVAREDSKLFLTVDGIETDCHVDNVRDLTPTTADEAVVECRDDDEPTEQEPAS